MWQGFQWDADKAKSNIEKHRISFEEATTVLDDPLSRTITDSDHSDDEQRFITLGHSRKGKLLVVCHCDREEWIRIISAREAVKQERVDYEAEIGQ
jgi:uncharacterized protein